MTIWISREADASCFCAHALEVLWQAPRSKWAELWVAYKMEFCHRYSKGRIFSTAHGIDFFQNVIDTVNGKCWCERDDNGRETDYSKAFNAMCQEQQAKK